jgi:hypothetical protein
MGAFTMARGGDADLREAAQRILHSEYDHSAGG